MLPVASRVRRPAEFRQAIRKGRRASRGPLTVHLFNAGDGPPRAGFVIPRAVGNAVVRNRTRRRLRHLLGVRLTQLASGSDVVVRVGPGAGALSSLELATALDGCLSRLAGPKG